MDCQNCGAPVRVTDGRGFGHCDYCDSYVFPSQWGEFSDGIASIDQPGECDCPRCTDRLSAGLIDNVAVEFCEKCRGFLIENNAFSILVRQRRAEYTGPERKLLPLNQADLQRRIKCPRCTGKMDVHPYYGPGNAIIDSCGRCHLVWMDCGELANIESAPGRR